MNAKKFAITLGVVIGLFVVVMIATYFYQLGMDKSNSPQKAQTVATVVTDKDKIPSLVTGTIATVDSDKLTIKQFANFDLEYQLNKADVASIVSLEKNPSYDPQKAAEKQKEIMDELDKAGIDPTKLMNVNGNSNLDAAAQQKLTEITSEAQNDPALNQMIEKNINWSELKPGVQVNYAADADGKTKLTVYPPDMNIGPPAQQ